MNLKKLGACSEAVKWYETQENDEQAWAACERGDWLLWLLGRIKVDRKRLVLCCCECARLSLKYVPENENRPRIAIETAEKWAKGEASIEEVRAAAYAAADADAAAYAAAADAAAYAAAAAAAYAYAAAAVAPYAAARSNTLKQCADIVRKHFTFNDIDT